MNQPHQAVSAHCDGWISIADSLRRPVEARLAAGEFVVAFMLSDIDSERHFRTTLLVVTHAHFLSHSTTRGIFEWPIAEVEKLKSRDRGGFGTLELIGRDRRLGVWHFTNAQGPATLILVDKFDEVKSNRPAAAVVDEEDVPEAEEHGPPPNSMALLRLLKFAQPYAFWMLLALVFSLISNVAVVASASLVEPLFNTLTKYQQAPGAGLGSVWWYLFLMFLAALLGWILAWAQGAILAWVSERVVGNLREKTFGHMMKLSLEDFGGKRTGDLMSRISSDSERLCGFLSDSIVDFMANFILLCVVAFKLVSKNGSLAAITLLPFPFIVWLMYYARDRLHTGFQTSSRSWAGMNSVLADTIPGIRVVKAFAQEDREIERFQTANRNVIASNDRVNSLWTFFWPLITFLNSLGVIVVWVFGVWLISRQVAGTPDPDLNVGALAAFVTLTTLFYGKLEMMSRIVNAWQRANASTQRILEILDKVSSVPEPAKPVSPGKLRGDLEFRHVGFRYGSRKVIHDFTVKIEAGEMIGLVGRTGAGKSTLINLVCRFFDVAEGSILADGVDIRNYQINQYRSNVGIVLQDPFLFYGSIAENIAYGYPGATREQIINAAKAARAHEFILNQADGYDSLVGERGQSLSGGERQRISIARALLLDPRILILDEATSALDSTTERQIQEALQNLVRGRTTIAIAHRLSTLRQANRIMVVERGRLIEIGTHEELLKLDGAYASLHNAQQELTKDIGW